MNNNEAMNFFSKLIKKNDSQGVEKYGHDTTNLDAEFLYPFLRKNISLLDIGSGTGLILNKIFDLVGSIDAIEPYSEFSKYIIKNDKITIHNINFFDFQADLKFDLMTLFGFMHYFNENEAKAIYEKCFVFLNKNGKIIIKNQFGIKDNVNVSGYSEELNSNYFAQYRCINKEIELLDSIGFINIEFFDIYPPECNRWDNTHFYAIVASKE